MARITIHAVQPNGEPHRWTLSEHIVAKNLDNEHYTTQLLERLSWATAEAEALESPSADLDADRYNDARRTQPTTRSRGNSASRRLEHTSSRQRPHSYDTSPKRHDRCRPYPSARARTHCHSRRVLTATTTSTTSWTRLGCTPGPTKPCAQSPKA
jgi:hypothetical protein